MKMTMTMGNDNENENCEDYWIEGANRSPHMKNENDK